MILIIKTIPVLTYIIIIYIYKFIRFKLFSTSISFLFSEKKHDN